MSEHSTAVPKHEAHAYTALIRPLLNVLQRLYHVDHKTSPKDEDARSSDILRSIAKEGTYRHTFDELQYGARVAWRNAAKCANRKVCFFSG